MKRVAQIASPLLFTIMAGFPPVAVGNDKPLPVVDTAVYTRPADLVPVDGGRRLNMICMGSGSPTVVFESGLGAGAVAYRRVQAAVAQFTKACAYDRAGNGFSDPLTRAADATNSVDDLRRLLTARFAEPVVLVGHSAGGLYVQMLATDHPELVSGVILIDPSGRDESRMVWQIMTDEERASTATNYRAAVSRTADCLAKARARALPDQPKDCSLSVERDPALAAEMERQYSRVEYWELRSSESANFDSGNGASAPTNDQAVAKPFRLGDKPLLVLNASYDRVPPGERGKQLSALLSTEEKRVVSASPQGRLVLVPNSGHVIQNDQPGVVISAVREVVEKVRAGS